jgi:hypothetical protein
MADDFRTPYDPGYAAAIGSVIFIFAVYEWNVIHIPGPWRTIVATERTSDLFNQRLDLSVDHSLLDIERSN